MNLYWTLSTTYCKKTWYAFSSSTGLRLPLVCSKNEIVNKISSVPQHFTKHRVVPTAFEVKENSWTETTTYFTTLRKLIDKYLSSLKTKNYPICPREECRAQTEHIVKELFLLKDHRFFKYSIASRIIMQPGTSWLSAFRTKMDKSSSLKKDTITDSYLQSAKSLVWQITVKLIENITRLDKAHLLGIHSNAWSSFPVERSSSRIMRRSQSDQKVERPRDNPEIWITRWSWKGYSIKLWRTLFPS